MIKTEHIPHGTLANVRSSCSPIWKLATPYLVLIPLIYLAVAGQFSFDNGALNTAMGQTGTLSGGSGGLIWKVEIGLAYSVIAYLAVANFHGVLATMKRSKIVIFIAIYATLSTLWSQSPVTSIKNAFFLWTNIVFAAYLCAKFSHRRLIELFIFAGLIIALLSFLLALVAPKFGLVGHTDHVGALQGLFSEKNAAAKTMVFLILPAFIPSNATNLPFRFISATLMFAFIVLTQSRTGWINMGVLLSLLWIVRKLRKFPGKDAFILMTLGLMFFATLLAILWTKLPAILGALNRDSTMSGRTIIWSTVFASILKRSLLGYGYGAFWTGMSGESGTIYTSLNWVFAYAHNGILEVWSQLGAIGVGLILVATIVAAKDVGYCFRRGRIEYVSWYIGLIAVTVLYNLDEGTLLFPNQLVSVMFYILCFGAANLSQEVRSFQPLDQSLYTNIPGTPIDG